MKVSISARIIASMAVALAVLTITSAVSYRNLHRLTDDRRRVVHTYEVLLAEQRLGRAMADLQGLARGYVISGDPSQRDEMRASAEDADSALGELGRLTNDNPRQQARIDRLQGLVTRRTASAEQLVRLRDSGKTVGDTQMTDSVLEGTRITRSIREVAREIEEEERALLEQRANASDNAEARTTRALMYGTLLAVLFGIIATYYLRRSIRVPLGQLGESAARVAGGDYAHRATVFARDEIGALAVAFNAMAVDIERRQVALAAENWLTSSLARLAHMLEGKRSIAGVAETVLTELSQLLEFQHGAVYVPEPDVQRPRLVLQAVYAVTNAPEFIESGERLVGQAYADKRRILLDTLPDNYVRIGSAIGDAPARNLLVTPAVLEGGVRAVIELAAFRPWSEIQLKFIDQFSNSLALVFATVTNSVKTEELLRLSQELSQSLAVKQTELEQRNDELEQQGQELRASEETLQEQQEELKQANEELEQTNEELRQTSEELEERARLLNDQKKLLEQSNVEIDTARISLQQKSEQLTLTSKYKSEFLANMSHELRTPLNSLLILAKVLSDNTEGTLTDKQIRHAQTIQASGRDLLRLIDDILDLSKVEAGVIELEIDDFPVTNVVDATEATFRPIAQNRGLALEIEVAADIPKTLRGDAHRLQQVLKNLLSNAFKFTPKGTVQLSISRAQSGSHPASGSLARADTVLAFAVKDSGIGIPEDRQKIIFEAFQQAEAGTARKYGGTGLGLSISRELASLMGGTLSLKSAPGEGSTFTLYIPARIEASTHEGAATPTPVRVQPRAAAHLQAASNSPRQSLANNELEADLIEDDRESIVDGDAVLLVIEDDRNFAYVLSQCAHERNFKVVVAGTCTAGIALARRIKPTAITLDLHLPDNDGRMVLDLLKHDPEMRHIPIHVISVDAERDRLLREGAVSFLQKPVTREALDEALAQAASFTPSSIRRLLVVEDDPVQQAQIRELIGNGDVAMTVVATGADALQELAQRRYDCIVLDLGLPDQGGADLIREMQKRHGARTPPVVVYTAKALTRREESELRGLSEAIVIKDARSPERLLDETALFLHRVQSKLPESQRRLLERVQREDVQLSGRKVLVVDDDLRNIFAISTALENYKMIVSYAESGKEALTKLEKDTDVAAILMDVMMPEMDGFEATRRIRSMRGYAEVPIIMVTAKAMRGDREKCLEAGASDYVTKPVDMDQLRSLLRVWLYR
jgi:CheY-like chemotaxis protein